MDAVTFQSKINILLFFRTSVRCLLNMLSTRSHLFQNTYTTFCKNTIGCFIQVQFILSKAK